MICSKQWWRLVALFLVVGRMPLPSAAAAEPVQTLSEAIRFFGEGNYAEAAAILNRIPENSPLSGWTTLYRGKVAEKLSQPTEALKHFRRVPVTSAASLQARLGEIRIRALAPEPETTPPDLQTKIAELEDTLRLLSRNESLAELQFLVAVLAEKRGDRQQAIASYALARNGRLAPELRVQARDASHRLGEALIVRSKENSVTWMLDEAELLLREQEITLALQFAQRARALSLKNSEQYFTALLQEEKAVRAQGRKEEAERILAVVASEGSPKSAERAAFKMIRGSWNRDEHTNTLQLIQNYRKRFQEGEQPEELLFIESRSFEDAGRFGDARAGYLQLAASKSIATRLRGIRPLAWMHFRQREYVNAAEAFRRGMSEAQAAVTTLLRRDHLIESLAADKSADTNEIRPADLLRRLRDFTDEREHHRYWLAYLLNKLDSRARKQLSFEPPDPLTLWQTQVEEAPRSYYAMLARKELAPSLGKREPASPECLSSLPKELSVVLESLRAAGLLDLAEFEIDYSLAEKRELWLGASEALNGSKNFQVSELRFLLSRIDAYTRFANVGRAVAIADSLYKRPAFSGELALTSCISTIRSMAYPQPYAPLFEKAASDSGLPVSLIYALSRTESFFDAKAVSSRDARGLMQLLESTATMEGKSAQESLFDPSVNTRLGAKHLAGLMRRYAAEAPFAIAAYNAGANAVDRWRMKFATDNPIAWLEQISYPETRDYVKKVLAARDTYERLGGGQ